MKMIRKTATTIAFLLLASSALAAPKKNVTDLGVLKGDGFSGPGDVLKGKIEKVGAGGTLTFVAPTNQIWGLGDLTVEPGGAAKIKQTLVKAKVPGALGGATYYRYSITLPETASGPVTIRTSGNYQTRNDPHWAFEFSVSPEKGAVATSNYQPIPFIPGSIGGSDVPGANVSRGADRRNGAKAPGAASESTGAGVAR